MKARLLIDYDGGSCEIESEHPNAFRDILRLLKRIKDREDRTVVQFDRGGHRHSINLARVDRVDFTWEPAADAPAEPAPSGHREPVTV